jgi:hypothetical protein
MFDVVFEKEVLDLTANVFLYVVWVCGKEEIVIFS